MTEKITPPRFDGVRKAESYDTRWWLSKEPHETVFANAKRLGEPHRQRLQHLRTWLELYSNRSEDIDGDRSTPNVERAKRNIVLNAVNSVHSNLVVNRPTVTVVTSADDWSAGQRAKSLTAWLDGKFDELKLYGLREDQAHDALVFGTGVLHVFDNGWSIDAEVVFPGDILVESRESQSNSVRQMYRCQGIDMDMLTARFPGKKKKIELSKCYGNDENDLGVGEEELTKRIEVIECWHLPERTAKGELINGRRVMCTSECTLIDEPWEHMMFPFEFLHYCRHPRSFWGMGLPELMAGAQTELNETTRSLAASNYLSVPHILNPSNIDLEVSDVTNSEWSSVKYTPGPNGERPEFLTPPPFHPGQLQWAQYQAETAYADQGVSEMSARSETRRNLTSGKAINADQNVESKRFAKFQRDYEQGAVGAARQAIRVATDIANDENRRKSLEALSGDDSILKVDWKEADMRDKPHLIKVQPVSAFSRTFAAKLEEVQQLTEMQLLEDKDEIRELLSMPDIDKNTALRLSGRRVAEYMVDQALKGKQSTVIPEMDLKHCQAYGLQQLNLAVMGNAPDKSIEAVRSLLGFVDNLLSQAEQAAQQAAQMQMAQQAPQQAPAQPMPMQ